MRSSKSPKNESVKILIAEDSPTQAEQLKHLLEDRGYTVTVAANGEQALAAAHKRKPTLIISDILMPEMDGYTLCKRIKSDEELGDIPVMLVTSLTSPHDILKGLGCGADNFITKPYEERYLFSRIEHILSNRQLTKREKVQFGAEIHLAGKRHFITAEQQQILGLLISTYEEAVRINEELQVKQKELKQLADQLEQKVEKRTAILRTEITERKRAEEALRESEERVRLLLDSTAEAIYGLDLHGNCTFTNPACLHLLGYVEPSDMLGKNMHRLIHHTRPDGTPYPEKECRIYEAFQRGQGTHADGEVLWRADGTSFPAEYWAYPVRHGEKIVGAVVTFLDITERRTLEQQFRQAQKMEGIGRLAGGVAHDFNNLLNVILGYSELVLEALNPADPLRNKVEEVYKAGERAIALTRQLLAFSRKQVLEPRVLDLNAVVAGAEKLLQRLIGEDIDLVTALDPALGRVRSDPGQIEQIIMNLAINSRDAMPQGGKLTIETADVELDDAYARGHVSVVPGRYVMLAVSDTGCGMGEETQSHIFEPFFTTKEQGKGTGLGLATVYGIVKQSGGNIWVYSELGKGTTLKIYLPRVEEAVEAVTPREAIAAPARGSETVLVVEDEASLRQLVCETLETRGYAVLEAKDGAEALLVASKHKGRIHLLVTDVVMPGMSGRELAKRLAPLRPGMKILFMSGYSEIAIVHHGVLDPGTALLQKPFRPADLARKVREVLDVDKGP